jgi:predicted amidohydrolase YtcJ
MASRLTTYIVVLIVAGTLIAGLIVGAQREDASGPVDLIVTNGKVYRADGRDGFAEAVAVQGNKILRVGSNREIKRLRRAQTVMIDAHGGAVLPGFNDAHLHFIGGGLALHQLNLLEATTLESVQEAIEAYASAHPERPWVHGRGWYYAPFPGGLPTRQQLDALVPDRPAYLTAYDGHTGWANTKALKLAGITRRTRDPRNGTIVKDARTGEPTGVLKEAAMGLMRKVLPAPTREDRVQAIRDAIGEAHRAGITSIQNASGTPDDLVLYDELRQVGDLSVRVYGGLSAGPGFSEADADRFEAIRREYPDDPLFKAGVVKLMADGVVETHTAAMLAPYANAATTGLANFTPQELDRVVALLDRRGWQVMVHAIGDRGIRLALDAFEHAQGANQPPARGRRHRIEHIETIDPADVPRFAQLGVIASMQPYHGVPTPNQTDVWSANLGEVRSARAWHYGSILSAGGRLAFGSDWPVVALDPWLGLHVASQRTSLDDLPEGGWLPAERLPLTRAIDAYTSGAAYASFDDQRKGTLTKGMLADLVILTADIFAPEARLQDTAVHMTIFDGRIVYSREEAEQTQ